MGIIKLLDCTLRDGGYVNNWDFGYQNIKMITKRLAEAKIDIIECGFLEDGDYQPNRSLFSNTVQVEQVIPERNDQTEYVVMTRLG
ncbi:4-hydroxy-2-ketovalerate aldolase, partial [Salmonella enterica subsp. enterica serovar Typhi]|nr:4-hydroxy-2-ketovalerate aldolase [Salmonella enterica subsp. enterica serovar Typhi]